MPSVMATMSRDAGVGGFHDRVGRAGRRDEDHARVAPVALTASATVLKTGSDFFDCAPSRCSAAAGCDPADELRAVEQALIGVEAARLAGDPLADHLGVRIDQNAHVAVSAGKVGRNAAAGIYCGVILSTSHWPGVVPLSSFRR